MDVVIVTSPRSSSGKTALAVSIAKAAQERGQKTRLLEVSDQGQARKLLARTRSESAPQPGLPNGGELSYHHHGLDELPEALLDESFSDLLVIDAGLYDSIVSSSVRERLSQARWIWVVPGREDALADLTSIAQSMEDVRKTPCSHVGLGMVTTRLPEGQDWASVWPAGFGPLQLGAGVVELPEGTQASTVVDAYRESAGRALEALSSLRQREQLGNLSCQSRATDLGTLDLELDREAELRPASVSPGPVILEGSETEVVRDVKPALAEPLVAQVSQTPLGPDAPRHEISIAVQRSPEVPVLDQAPDNDFIVPWPKVVGWSVGLSALATVLWFLGWGG